MRKKLIGFRDEAILKLCANKKVLHIGACDWPFTKEKYFSKDLLFLKIEKVSKAQLGIDLSKDSINFLKLKKVNNIKYFDMNKLEKLDFDADIIIFGETLEHLTNLGIALNNLKKGMNKDTKLIITVPNATRFMNFVSSIFSISREHFDHKVAFTHSTLSNLLKAEGFKIVEDNFSLSDRKRKKISLYNKLISISSNLMAFIFPYLSPKLFFIVKIK